MATDLFIYRSGAENPGIVCPWSYESAANTWTALDLSTGFTFSLTLTDSAGTVALTKTTNITGTSTGFTIAWATGELVLTVGLYTMNVRVTETATSLDRDYRPGNPVRVQIT